jgi:hypothetical protein
LDRRDRLLVVAFAVATVVLAGSWLRATETPFGYEYLNAFREIKPDQSVVVATVVAVENRKVAYGGSGVRTRPSLELKVEEVLWGSPMLDKPIFGILTFIPEGSTWNVVSVEGRSWILPGDRVLLLLTWVQQARVDGENSGASVANAERYLRSGALSDSMALQKQARGSIDRAIFVGDKRSATLAEILSAVQVKRVATEDVLGDVKTALAESQLKK